MLIFLDVETTGLDVSDKIVSIGLVVVDEEISTEYSALVNEGKKIPPKASSIHHITNEMIKDKSLLRESEPYIFLESFNQTGVCLVGHNINFDLKKLYDSVGFEWQGEMVDTLRVSKHLLPESEEFSLQFLRYDLKLYRDEKEPIVIHDALSDAKVVKSLYEYLLTLASDEEIQRLSFVNVLMQKFEFGKYAGRYIEEISMLDSSYLQWMLNNIMDLDEDLRYSIKHYLQG